MKCPICEAPAKDTDQECGCGEVLTTWANIRRGGHALRQRGLVLAGEGDYVGAALSFLEAALTNPFDDKSVLDAARALVPLGRSEDALRLLGHAAARPASRATATAVAQAIRALDQRARAVPAEEGNGQEVPPGDTDGAAAPAPEPVAPAADPAPPGPRPFLALGPVERRKGWRRRAADPLWAKVLGMETNGERDWGGGAAWLEEALEGSEGQGALHYLLGLGAWRRNDAAAARRHFANCVRDNPPVLNAAAYYLCLSLDSDARARKALEDLLRFHSRKEMDVCLAALAGRLADGDDPNLHKQLRALMAKEEAG
jgi:hypothetical protein